MNEEESVSGVACGGGTVKNFMKKETFDPNA